MAGSMSKLIHAVAKMGLVLLLVTSLVLITVPLVYMFSAGAAYREGRERDHSDNSYQPVEQKSVAITLPLNASIKLLLTCEFVCPIEELNCTELKDCIFHYPDYCEGVTVSCRKSVDAPALMELIGLGGLWINCILCFTIFIFLSFCLATSSKYHVRKVHAILPQGTSDATLLQLVVTRCGGRTVVVLGNLSPTAETDIKENRVPANIPEENKEPPATLTV